MKPFRFLGILLLSMMLLSAGCATVPKADQSEDAAAKQFRAPADKGRVYIYRSAFIGQAVAIPIHINGKPWGQTQGKSYLIADLAPGEHTFLSKAENDSTVKVNVEAGKLYFVWQEVNMGFVMARAHLWLVDASKGRADVMQTSLLVPTLPEPEPQK
jgi:hypothetical protein